MDIDYEDDFTNGNPGLTGYGNQRTCGGGPAVAWLCTLTSTLRQLLPREKGYVLSHAPQPAYFDIGYAQVYQQCGDDIDFLNVQFYNQGEGAYSTYETLVLQETIHPPPPTCTDTWDGALVDIIDTHHIPQEKVVIGKIVGQHDGGSGWVDPTTLASIVQQARQKYPNLAGVFGWQWGSDTVCFFFLRKKRRKNKEKKEKENEKENENKKTKNTKEKEKKRKKKRCGRA